MLERSIILNLPEFCRCDQTHMTHALAPSWSLNMNNQIGGERKTLLLGHGNGGKPGSMLLVHFFACALVASNKDSPGWSMTSDKLNPKKILRQGLWVGFASAVSCCSFSYLHASKSWVRELLLKCWPILWGDYRFSAHVWCFKNILGLACFCLHRRWQVLFSTDFNLQIQVPSGALSLL